MIIYRGYQISFNPKPVPMSIAEDWDFAHPDYDGAPDSGDARFGSSSTLRGALDRVDELVEEADDNG